MAGKTSPNFFSGGGDNAKATPQASTIVICGGEEFVFPEFAWAARYPAGQ